MTLLLLELVQTTTAEAATMWLSGNATRAGVERALLHLAAGIFHRQAQPLG